MTTYAETVAALRADARDAATLGFLDLLAEYGDEMACRMHEGCAPPAAPEGA